VHVIASDVHSPGERPILLKEVYKFLSEHYTEQLARLLLEKNPSNIIKNKELESMVEGYFEPEMPQKSLGDRIRNFWRK
jgi:tyrosine-protein phosphatase YwqE